MKKLNHYFQKVSLKSIVLILVTTMLLTIPRMNVYSVVGAYQRTSTAITVNNNFQLHKGDKESPVAPAFVAGSILASLVVGFAVLALVGGAVGVSVLRNENNGQQHTISLDHINYDKYNFSQFDNYTPSSMKPETRRVHEHL